MNTTIAPSIALLSTVLLVACGAQSHVSSSIPSAPFSPQHTAASETRGDTTSGEANGAFYDWGDNDAGQLGVGTTGPKHDAATPEPAQLPPGTLAISGAAGQSDTLAVTTDGAVYAWGFNNYGELGDGDALPQNVPVKTHLPTGVSAVAAAAGYKQMLALTSAGTVYGWGFNANGQLGIGSTKKNVFVPVPVRIPSGVTVTAIAAGKYHSLVATSSGLVYAFGLDSNGQLGDNSTQQESLPVIAAVPNDAHVADVAAGDAHSLALTSSAVYAWGANSFGQLGDGNTAQSNVPVLVQLPSGAIPTAIAAGENYSMALTSTGTIYAWGDNADGNLGNGTTINSDVPVPVDVPPGVTVVAIIAGGNRCHFLSSAGAIYDWGTNENGQHATLVPNLDENPASLTPVALFDGPDAEQYIVLEGGMGLGVHVKR